MGVAQTDYEDVIKLELECDVIGCDRQQVLRIPKNPRGDGARTGIPWKVVTISGGSEEKVRAVCPIHDND